MRGLSTSARSGARALSSALLATVAALLLAAGLPAVASAATTTKITGLEPNDGSLNASQAASESLSDGSLAKIGQYPVTPGDCLMIERYIEASQPRT